MSYVQVDKSEVLTELNDGAVMYVVDIPTLRVMECANMTLSVIKSFIDKPETMFFKVSHD